MALVKRGKYWHSQFMYKGTTYSRSTKTTNRQTATAIDHQFRDEVIKAEELGIRGTITVKDALELYKERPPKRSKDAAYKETGQTRTLLKYIDGDMNIHQLHDRHVSKLISKMIADNYSVSYINGLIHILGHTNKICLKNGYSGSVAEFKMLPKEKKQLRYLEYEEEKKLLDALNPTTRVGKFPNEVFNGKDTSMDAYDFAIICLDTGMRSNELMSLSWPVVDFDKKRIRVFRSKVGNESLLYMTPRVEEILRRRYTTIDSPTERIFLTKYRRRIQRKIIRAMDRIGLNDEAVLAEKGVRANVHTLRKTFASRLVMEGEPIEAVSRALGHSSIKMTQDQYAFLAPDLGTESLAKTLANFNKEQSKAKLVAVN